MGSEGRTAGYTTATHKFDVLTSHPDKDGIGLETEASTRRINGELNDSKYPGEFFGRVVFSSERRDQRQAKPAAVSSDRGKLCCLPLDTSVFCINRHVQVFLTSLVFTLFEPRLYILCAR